MAFSQFSCARETIAFDKTIFAFQQLTKSIATVLHHGPCSCQPTATNDPISVPNKALFFPLLQNEIVLSVRHHHQPTLQIIKSGRHGRAHPACCSNSAAPTGIRPIRTRTRLHPLEDQIFSVMDLCWNVLGWYRGWFYGIGKFPFQPEQTNSFGDDIHSCQGKREKSDGQNDPETERRKYHKIAELSKKTVVLQPESRPFSSNKVVAEHNLFPYGKRNHKKKKINDIVI